MRPQEDPREDRALLAAVADEDAAALQVLYDRHAAWLTLRLARRCNDRGLVDEVLQDTFLAVWRSAAAYRGSGEVAAWLWGIAIRRLVDALRQRAVRPRLVGAGGLAHGPAPTVEEHLLLGVEHGDLAGALQQLSPELRAVLQATVLDGLTTREAATYLGIPAGTVKTRMQRARRQLREALA